MKTWLMEVGAELIKSSPCSGAIILQVADVLTLGFITNVVLLAYGLGQLCFLVWRWRTAYKDRKNGAG